ncbi:MAG: phosphatase PAP2 family protein [Pseudomonadota bacterium]
MTEISAGLSRPSSFARYWAQVPRIERRRASAMIIVGFSYAAIVLAVTLIYGRLTYFRIASYGGMSAMTAWFIVCVTFLAHSVQLLQKPTDKGYWRQIAGDISKNVLAPRKFIMYATPFVVVPFFIAAFTSLKTQIPFIVGFSWDEALFAADRWLHGGVDPWVWTHSLFGSDIATTIIGYFYNAWFGVIWLFFMWWVFKLDRPVERTRYILAFMFVWIGMGSITALGLSSVGPCFYGRIVPGVDPYAGLMTTLEAINARVIEWPGPFSVWALTAQEHLWFVYTNDLGYAAGGISAMPSMHVSIAVLMACAARHISRKMFIIMVVYAIITMIGSVHLAWHYALDGYVSAIGTVAIWWATGRVMRRFKLDDPTGLSQSKAAPVSG